jgi:ABC-type transport system substrate-binding protein
MASEENYWTRRRLGRRSVLRGAGTAAVGLAGAMLIACGGGDDSSEQGSGGAGASGPGAAGGGSATEQTPTNGGLVRFIYDSQTQPFLSPRSAKRGNDPNFLLTSGDSLIYLKADGTFQPDWSLLERSEWADQTTFVGQLRSGITFHDGTPLDAAAVKANLEFLNDAKLAPDFAYRSLLQPLAAIETPDPLTLRFRLKQPSSGFPVTVLAFTPGIPFSMAQVNKLGDDEIVEPSMTGPYKVESWRDGGAKWSYVQNTNYWRKAAGLPYLDKIEYQGAGQDEARAAAIEAGEVEAVVFNASNETTARLSKNRNLQAREFEAGPAMLLINHAKAPLDNLKLRQAIAHALDKQKMLAVLYQDQGAVAKSELPRGTFGYYEYDPYPFDQNKAKELVAASGVRTPIRITYALTGTPPSAAGVQTASLFKEMLDAVGFDVAIQNVANTQDFYARDATHLGTTGTGTRPDPVEQYATYDTSNANFNAGKKSTDPAQKQVDDLVAKARAEYDTAAREKLVQELAKVCRDNVISNIPTVARTRWAFASTKVGGFDHPEFLNVPGGSGFRAFLLWMRK